MADIIIETHLPAGRQVRAGLKFTWHNLTKRSHDSNFKVEPNF